MTKRGNTKYQLLLRNSKKYKNIKFRRNRKVIYKGKLFFLQYESTNKKNIQKAVKVLKIRGIQAAHIKLLRRSQKKSQYIISYDKPKDETWFKALDYSIAQSKLRFETHILDSDYESNYLDFLTGAELNSDSYEGKIMFRASSLTEKNENNKFSDSELELDETYINRTIGDGQITIGKQLFSWGVFDEFSNFDRVNIKNLKRFIFDSGEDYRRPITAIRYEHYLSDWKVDFFFNFGNETGKILSEDSIWFGVDREEGLIRGGDTSIIDPNLIKFVSIHQNDNIENGHGLRLSHSGAGDFSITYLRAYADLPILKFSNKLKSEINSNSISPSGLNSGVELLFVNEDVFGLDYVRTIGEQLYKLEFSYIPNSLVVSKELDLIEVQKGRFSVGGDIELNLFSTTIVWQLIHEKTMSSDQLFLNDTLTQSIIHTSSRFNADKLETGVRFVFNNNDNSSYLSPYLNYEINDSNTLGGSYNHFNGESDSFYGYHKNESFMALNYSYIF
ncbi:MAG: hypothetical protein ACJAS4_003349 [Bacteriovoracaceae bacterium]